MTNLHPILVHFPVALLTVYALLEILRFKKLTSQAYWFYVKASFVLTGSLGSLVAFLTGEGAEHAAESGEVDVAVSNFRQVVELHETFAMFSVIIFGIIAVSYLTLWVHKAGYCQSHSIFLKLVSVASFLVETPFAVLLAVLGLVCITVTGGLGGVMVYGPGADPFFEPIYRLLIGK